MNLEVEALIHIRGLVQNIGFEKLNEVIFKCFLEMFSLLSKKFRKHLKHQYYYISLKILIVITLIFRFLLSIKKAKF